VDDLTELVNSCELHILEGIGTKKVAIGVVNAIDLMRTPRIHGQPVPEGYARVLLHRVERGCASVPLDIEGGDGEKTLGEAEKTFVGISALSSFLESHCRHLVLLMIKILSVGAWIQKQYIR